MRHFSRVCVVTIAIFILPSSSTVVGYMTLGVVNHQMPPNNTFGEAQWSADVDGDGNAEARGWVLYTLEKGVAGRIIKISGTWGTDDGNLSGGLTTTNLIFYKFRGVYQGLFIGNVSGDSYNAKFLGFLYNDWEVGYWKIIMPVKIKVQVVHIPFASINFFLFQHMLKDWDWVGEPFE